MTQEELAEKIGTIGLKSISAYERGTRKIPYDLLLRMAKIFAVAPIELADQREVAMTSKELLDWDRENCMRIASDEAKRERVRKFFEMLEMDLNDDLRKDTSDPE